VQLPPIVKARRGRLWDNQPQPPRYTASRQRFGRAASEVRYHRVSRAASNHTQTLITFAYHQVRKGFYDLPQRGDGFFRACRGLYAAGLSSLTIKRALSQSPRSSQPRVVRNSLPSATSPESGILRIDGDDGPLAFAVLNSAPRARAALRPREAGRLLDALGRIEHYEGFDDLLDLFERHVLGAEHVSQPA
jgi:hypothetical protein